MTYLQLAAVFLGISVVVAGVAWRYAPRPVRRHVLALAITAGALVVLTAVFDTIMIATGLFAYAEGQIAGVRVGLAPIEDFAYPIAGALLLSGLWNLSARRRRPDAD